MSDSLEGLFPGNSQMARTMRTIDWSRTALGPPTDWPQSLRTAVGMMLNSRYPMFIAWGDALTYLYNDGYRPILGEKHPAALGRSFDEVWSEIWEDISPLVQSALAGEPTWSENLQLFMERRGFPEEVYFTFSYSPIHDERRRVGGMLCACTETTEGVFGERQLALLHDLASETANCSGWLDVCTRASDVLGRNQKDIVFSLTYIFDEKAGSFSLAASSGVSAEDAAALWTQPSGQAAPWPLAEVIRGSKVRLANLDAQDGLPSGDWKVGPRSIALVPIAPTGQTGKGGVLVAGLNPHREFDSGYQNFLALIGGQISASIASAQAYEEERMRAEALAELDRAKTLFFSDVSHEFRTPLTLMLGPLEDLQSDGLQKPQASQNLQTAYRNSLRLLRLVNTLLDFSRIESGRIEAVYERTDIAGLTRDLASNFRSAVERAGLQFFVECLPPSQDVYVDRDMWEKIVLNLLSNALKFTFEGEIRVHLSEEDGSVVLAVSDTGTGIRTEDLPRVFDRFYRIRDVQSRTFEGSGIGLALVQELVKLHGGDVSVESFYGRGSTFRVRIPAGKAHLHAGAIGDSTTPASASLGATPFVEEALRWLDVNESATAHRESAEDAPVHEPIHTPGPSQAATILFADDNADMREYVSRLLAGRWNVVAVADGKTALSQALNQEIDLVLSDVMMPGLDGFELLAALRGNPRTATIPVILLSARAGEESRVEGLEHGADDYLVKPFTARELMARVTAHLELARARRERESILRERSELAEKQRADLYSTFMQAPLPIAVFRGPDLTFDLVNPAYGQLSGGRAAVGKSLLEALPELQTQTYHQLLQSVMATGEPASGQEAIVKLERAGRLEDTYWSFVYAPLREVDGRIERVMAICNEVTREVLARKELESAAVALRQSEERFRSIFDQALGGIAQTDLNGRFLLVNDRFCEIAGRSRQDLESLHVHEITHPEDWPRNQQLFDALLDGGPDFEMEKRYVRPDGSSLWVHNSVSAIRGSSGKPTSVIAVSIDISDRKRAEEEIRAAAAMKDQFVGLISHELRTPISTLIANGSILLRHGDSLQEEDRKQALLDIVAEGSRLQRIIENLLLLSRVDAVGVDFAPLSLDELLSEQIHSFIRREPDRKIELELANEHCVVRGQADLLRIVIDNLLVNAHKYSPPVEAVKVTLGQTGEGDVEVRVRDHGIGIEEEELPNLFTPFYRTESGKKFSTGMGLGLAVCKRILDAHGGRIWVQSEAEGGAEFIFTLRAEQAVADLQGGQW